MSGAVHLQNRLDADDIVHIYQLKDAGVKPDEIARRYRISVASARRILDIKLWQDTWYAAWGGEHYEPPTEATSEIPKPEFDVTEPSPEPNGFGLFSKPAPDPLPAPISMTALQTLISDRDTLKEMLADNGKEILKELGM